MNVERLLQVKAHSLASVLELSQAIQSGLDMPRTAKIAFALTCGPIVLHDERAFLVDMGLCDGTLKILNVLSCKRVAIAVFA
jgi:hypothetical protein